MKQSLWLVIKFFFFETASFNLLRYFLFPLIIAKTNKINEESTNKANINPFKSMKCLSVEHLVKIEGGQSIPEKNNQEEACPNSVETNFSSNRSNAEIKNTLLAEDIYNGMDDNNSIDEDDNESEGYEEEEKENEENDETKKDDKLNNYIITNNIKIETNLNSLIFLYEGNKVNFDLEEIKVE